MELVEQYLSTAWRMGQESGFAQLTPAVLVRACREVLPVAAAGITLDDSLLRLPLAASNSTSGWVERLEATLGDGPCVDTMSDQLPLVAGPATMVVCWPAWTRQVLTRTPFRSVAALPLTLSDGSAFGALTLFADTPDLGDLLDVAEVTVQVGDLIAGILSGQLAGHTLDDLHAIGWTTDGLTRRRQVWTTVAIISATAQIPEAAALATLRANALRRHLTLDERADQLLTQHLQPSR